MALTEQGSLSGEEFLLKSWLKLYRHCVSSSDGLNFRGQTNSMYFKARNPNNSRGESGSSQESLLSSSRRGLGARDQSVPSDPAQRLSSSTVGASLLYHEDKPGLAAVSAYCKDS